MTLDEMLSKLTPEQRQNLKIAGNLVIYDAGTAIYRALIEDAGGQLVPLDLPTRQAIAALG